uniref:Uncharacterized protein n=1 Tax=Vitrella brassicaformis TaxID=1169539 RepID=A0A7S1K531_9ALVE
MDLSKNYITREGLFGLKRAVLSQQPKVMANLVLLDNLIWEDTLTELPPDALVVMSVNTMPHKEKEPPAMQREATVASSSTVRTAEDLELERAEFTDSYRTHVALQDHQHKRLFDILNAIIDCRIEIHQARLTELEASPQPPKDNNNNDDVAIAIRTQMCR